MPRYQIKLNNERRSHLETIIISIDPNTFNYRNRQIQNYSADAFSNPESKEKFIKLHSPKSKILSIDECIDKYTKQKINNENRNKTIEKAIVILLRASKKDIVTIMSKVKLSKRTVINYIVQYTNTNDTNWKFFFHPKKYVKLEFREYVSAIYAEFKERPPISYKEATLRIEKLYGIKRSETQVRAFLNKKKIHTIRSKMLSVNDKKSIRAKIRDNCPESAEREKILRLFKNL